MPGVCLNKLSQPRLREARTHCAAHAPAYRDGLMLFLLAASSWLTLHAETLLISADPLPNPVTHVTDAQDRVSNGHLAASADARSRANALYAQATLLTEDTGADLQVALGLYRQIINLDPSFVDAQVKLANLLLQTGQLDQAYDRLQSATAAHPGSIPLEVALGYTQRLRGQNEDAQKLCQHALTVDPTQAGAMRVLLEIAGDQDDLAGGVLHIEDILKSGGSDVPAIAWLNLARLYSEVARSERVPPADDAMFNTRLPILQQAAAKPPPDVDTLGLLGDTYRRLGRKAEALKTYRKAGALEPSNVDVILNCAELESDLGDITGAIKDYANADDLSPGLPWLRERLCALYFYEARQNRDRKNFKAALDYLDQVRALATGPQAGLLDVDYYLESALTLNLAGEKEKLEAILQEALVKYPNNPELMNELAYFWADHGNHLSEALELSRKAAELDPNNGPILDTRGWVYFQMGQPKDALPYLQRAAVMTNNDPVVLQHVGDAYLKLGLRHEAIATWTRALEKDPQNGDLTNRIDAAQAQAKNVHPRSAPTP